VPPPADTLFGKVADPNMTAACTNPVALGGGSGQVLANWGLHLVDVNLAMGNVVDIVAKQAKAWAAKTR
jgi:hypothetical protein